MRKTVMLLGFITSLFHPRAQKPDFSRYPAYTGKDLGVTFSPAASTFKVWSPVADSVNLVLPGTTKTLTVAMEKGSDGCWQKTVSENLKGRRYGYSVHIRGKWSVPVVDPYARAVTENGKWGVVIDLADTDPPGWTNDKRPAVIDPTSAIIYELHIRDATISPTSGARNRGKFLGLTETGTKNAAGLSTGLDHIAELGVTHVHLLPVYDFNSIDETKPDGGYNWGYDPLNYNVPEGSYATNAFDPLARIKEFKQLVKAFHERGINVVMDVVYNHTALTETSNFNRLVPGYYYRQTADGRFSNATACGNETASERPMFRKFMLESMKYWVEEYHIDGFRVDLMGVHDIATMNLISQELNRLRPGILLYGEGWTAGPSPLHDSLRALKANAAKLDRIAVFSDDMRDGLKGSVFEHEEKGFVSGEPGMEESVKFSIVAAGLHPQVDYSKVKYAKQPYTLHPAGVINYAECHDNHVLWDKLAISAGDRTVAERQQMYRTALALVLTSQGIPFLHAGTEMLRSKYGVENSYVSPDSINAINWDLKTAYPSLTAFVKIMIRLRKDHPAFRLHTSKEIRDHLAFLGSLPQGVIGYEIHGQAAGDSWKRIRLYFNGTGHPQRVNWPIHAWKGFHPEGSIGPGYSDGTTLQPYGFLICHD